MLDTSLQMSFVQTGSTISQKEVGLHNCSTTVMTTLANTILQNILEQHLNCTLGCLSDWW